MLWMLLGAGIGVFGSEADARESCTMMVDDTGGEAAIDGTILYR